MDGSSGKDNGNSGEGNESTNHVENTEAEESDLLPHLEVPIGPEFQAVIPPLNPHQEIPELGDVESFNPNKISESLLREYMHGVHHFASQTGFSEQLERFEIEELALLTLHKYGYDVSYAMIIFCWELTEMISRMQLNEAPNSVGDPNEDTN